MRYIYILFLSSLLTIGCNDSSSITPDPNMVLNESDEFQVCNNIVTDCRNGNGGYCLNGFKWGASNPLPNGGEVQGPMESGGVLTFSFQEENGLVNTHAQINLPSKSFSNLASCAKDEIRNALNEWSSKANISFEEQDENSESDIRIFVADIRQSGVGYPNFSNQECQSIGGTFVIQTNLWTDDCPTMYRFFLHEIGHVLGLGHVGTENIMTTDIEVLNSFDELQSGDIEGIVELYGPK